MSNCCQTVIFSDKAYNAVIDETFRKDPIETGGILLGHVLDNGLWVVMEVIPPGIDSIHQYAYFEYDEKFVNYLAESISTKYEKKLELLGLWHRHPGSMDIFSGTDDITNSVFAGLRPYGAISGLVNVDPNFRLTMRHVSNPLHYEIVDVEVGDDLIPDDYFKLRHFPEKGLNPAPYTEKKNDRMNSENMSEQKSNLIKKEIEKNRKSIFDVKSLKIILLSFLAFLSFSIAIIIGHALGIVNNDFSKQITLYEVVYNSNSDKLLLNKEPILNVVAVNHVLVKTRYTYRSPLPDINKIRLAYVIIAFILIGFIFIPINRRIFMYSIVGSFICSIIVLKLCSINYSIAFLTWLILLTLLLTLLTFGVLKLVEKVKSNGNIPWFQKRKDIFNSEEIAIRKVEPNAESSIEDGKLVYTIVTDRHITRQEHPLAYQMIYSTNYIKDGSIRIYFIMPDLADMFSPENKLKSSYLKVDDNGEYYLEFPTNDKILGGHETINKLYKWVDLYNRYRAGDISSKTEKL